MPLPSMSASRMRRASKRSGCSKVGLASMATFAPKRQGTLTIYHTEDLNMTPDEFQNAALALIEQLLEEYAKLTFEVEQFLIWMPSL